MHAKLQRAPNELELGEIDEYQLLRSRHAARRRRIVVDEVQTDAVDVPLEQHRVEKTPAPRMVPPRLASAMRGAHPPSTPPGGREAYERLAREFKEAEADEVRKRVSDRLEEDQKSANSLVRYYAVRTMSKLGASVFADALRAATNDEDATVRAVAVKALNR